MTVGLFVPCYVDQFYPGVAIATLQLLERHGCSVEVPLKQTCCGQPMANAGFASSTEGCNKNFIDNFASCDYIVSPSGSCVLHVKSTCTRAGGKRKPCTSAGIFTRSPSF